MQVSQLKWRLSVGEVLGDRRRVADPMEADAPVITAAQCMDAMALMIQHAKVEATFPGGTKLVTAYQLIRSGG